MMHTAISDPRVWERLRGASQLALLEAFEDAATASRIREFRHDLLQLVGNRCQIVEHVWLCNMFRFHELQEIAAEEAAVADLVVIAVHDAPSLPDEVKGWMELWLRQKSTRNTVLLALLESTPDAGPGPVEAYLKEAAKRGGIEFVVETREIGG